MKTSALIFLLSAWAFVLGLTFWSFHKLMQAPPEHEKLPPPGTIL